MMYTSSAGRLPKMSPYVFNTVLFPSYFVRVPSYFEALWYPHLYFDRKSNIAWITYRSMYNIA